MWQGWGGPGPGADVDRQACLRDDRVVPLVVFAEDCADLNRRQQSVPLTALSVPLTAFSVPLTASSVPLTASSVPLTALSVPLTACLRRRLRGPKTNRRRQCMRVRACTSACVSAHDDGVHALACAACHGGRLWRLVLISASGRALLFSPTLDKSARLYLRTNKQTSTRAHPRTQTHTDTDTDTQTHRHTDTHTRARTHTHTHTHAHIRARAHAGSDARMPK